MLISLFLDDLEPQFYLDLLKCNKIRRLDKLVLNAILSDCIATAEMQDAVDAIWKYSQSNKDVSEELLHDCVSNQLSIAYSTAFSTYRDGRKEP